MNRGLFKLPPLYFVQQNIGEASQRDGGVEKNTIKIILGNLFNLSPQELLFLRSLPYC